MKKFLSVILLSAIFMQFCFIPAFAENITVYDTIDYAFIKTNGESEATEYIDFNVPKGKTVAVLTLDGENVAEGDGVTKWDTFPSAVKNFIYDSENGTLSLSRRFIEVDTDLYGAKEIDLVIEFTDGDKGILRLNGVCNQLKLSSQPKDYSESTPSGYKPEEIKPDASWSITSSGARQTALNLIDGVTNQFHSYYKNEGSTIVYRDATPHYIDIDTGAETEISGFMYKPRTVGAGGSFTSVIYQGSDDGNEFTDIESVTYPGTLDTKITHFSENVTYRYYRIKIVAAVSGYATGDEIHLLKPFMKTDDRTIDISKSFDASFNLGTDGAPLLVSANEKALQSDSYTVESGTFTFKDEYIKSLQPGEYEMKICFEKAYSEFNIFIEDSASVLTDAKDNAAAELNAYGKDMSEYTALINSAASPEAIEEILDDAANAMGAEFITLPYKQIYTLSGGEILSSTVSKEGNELSDTSVLSVENGAFTATGLGRALVKSGDKFYLFKTKKADIAIVIVSGQSNAAGDSSDYRESPSALGKYKNRYLVTNSMNCALPLSGVSFEEATYTAEHSGVPSADFVSSTWSQKGWSAAEANQLGARLSDEWNMTVWVINTGICARIMDDFDPAKETHNAYDYTVNYVKKAKELVSENSHYILDETKTGFFWLQGCSDGIGTASENTMEEYTKMFMNMYSGWKKDIGINYAGIWLVRAGVNSNGDKDFYMSGPRLSQHYLGNSAAEEHKNIYLIMNTDIWRTNEGVNDYFTEKYPDAEAFKAYYGYARPSTYAEVKPDLHHRQKGYNELGDEAGRVIADIMEEKNAVPECAALLGFDGNEAPVEGFTLQKKEEVLAVPVSTTTPFNASFNLTVTVDNENIAVFDNDTFTLKGVSEGKTVARIKYNNKVLASYPVTVSGIINEILTERSKWEVTASSVEGTRGNPRHLTDGNTGTSFVADIKLKTPPHHFEILLPETTVVSGVGFDSYTDANGYPLKYEIYVSETENGEYKLVKSGSFDRASDALLLKSKVIDFDKNITVRKLKFVFTETVNGYAAMSEFYMYPEKSAPLKGDVNSDGVVDDNDVSSIAKYSARWVNSTLNFNLDVADINEDGTVNLLDAITLARNIKLKNTILAVK